MAWIARDKSSFFLANGYRDSTIFLFSLNAEITFFPYSGYRSISIGEFYTITENESIASVWKR